MHSGDDDNEAGHGDGNAGVDQRLDDGMLVDQDRERPCDTSPNAEPVGDTLRPQRLQLRAAAVTQTVAARVAAGRTARGGLHEQVVHCRPHRLWG